MNIVRLNLGPRSYNIVVAYGALQYGVRLIKGLSLGTYAYIITQPSIKKRYGALLEESLKKSGIKELRFKLLPETEKTKSLFTAASVINDIVRHTWQKRVFLVAFGGGVIGDLTGFVAALYKRGIPYIQIPTTLLAQVDAGIGGKTAVDLRQAKNLVGIFYQPRLVLSDLALLKTLNTKQMHAGLAEVIKYAIIKDRLLFKYLEDNYKKVMQREKKALEFIIARCSKIKADIVSKDEREEKGLRTILNLGHTIGHAIEAASGYKGYNHGEAVAIGLLCAADISLRLGLLKEKVYYRIIKLIRLVGLPSWIEGIPLKRIIASLQYDKKFIGEKNRFVLIKNIGKTIIKEDLNISLVKEVLLKRLVT